MAGRAIVCSFLLLLWAPQTKSLGDVWLEGTIGGAAVRVYLGDAGFPKTDGLWGMYFYTKYWTPIPLEGDWTATGRLELTEGDPGETAPQPTLDLKVSAASMDGTWTSADGKRVLPVKLTRVPKPAPFDVAIRRAQRFADPRWPFTLSYPAGWRLVVTDTELTLRSPDPEDMLFNNELFCTRGTGLPPAPKSGEPPVNFEGPFYRGPSGWLAQKEMYGDCTTGTCQPPASRKSAAGTFMKADAPHRRHGPWGYMGLAEAAAYLVVAGQDWASCTDRLLDTDTRISVAARR